MPQLEERCILSEYAFAVGRQVKDWALGLVVPEVRRLRRENGSLREENKRLREAVLRDELTGALTRVAFPHLWEAGVCHLRRSPSHPISVAVLDLDHFKGVNDRYLHEGGDAVLRHITQVMRAACRPYDHLFRWGGEEFLLLLDGADATQAGLALERVRNAVEQAETVFHGQKLRVTVSIGHTQVQPEDAPEQARTRADQALYWAKAAGRNCVRGN